MTNFTPCKLSVSEIGFDNDDTPETVIRGTESFSDYTIAVAIDFKNCPGMRQANAQRLVACWNALDGLPQDALDGGWTAIGISKHIQSLEQQLDQAKAEIERLTRGQMSMARSMERTLVGNQSAWIEWRNGQGAESAMQWIENALIGPGILPDEEDENYNDAQKYFDAHAPTYGP